MKKQSYISLILFLFFFVLISTTSLLFAQNTKTLNGISVKEISSSKWNTPDGIPYLAGPGVNLGAISFEVLDETRIAYLSNASNEIIIANSADGVALKKFSVSSAPRDFIYDKGIFYVLFGQQVSVYDKNGRIINNIPIPNIYLGVERITRFGNETYLLLPSGNCAKIESAGHAVAPQEFAGWITSTGNFISTKISGGNSYSVQINTADGKNSTKEFTSDKKIAGAYVAGSAKNRIVLDVQTFVSESPIVVERNIVTIELNQGEIGSIISTTKIPDCYYVLSNKDICILPDGDIINMITAPQGIFIFSLAEIKSGSIQDYPAAIREMKYHFNDHLIKAEEK